jgi:hypothetical protein
MQKCIKLLLFLVLNEDQHIKISLFPVLNEVQHVFGRHTAHHQEPKTAQAASGFAYVEGCWTCGW